MELFCVGLFSIKAAVFFDMTFLSGWRRRGRPGSSRVIQLDGLNVKVDDGVRLGGRRRRRITSRGHSACIGTGVKQAVAGPPRFATRLVIINIGGVDIVVIVVRVQNLLSSSGAQ